MIKKVYGKGINDADYPITSTNPKGKRVICPIYSKWKHMLERCYSNRDSTNRWYGNTEVCEEWLMFSNFKRWVESQDWVGKDLDKDLFGDGTLYSPETCIFIPHWLNLLITKQKGKFLPGVFYKDDQYRSKPYSCQVIVDGVRHRLGHYATEEEAHEVYCQKKIELVSKWLVDIGIEEPLRHKVLMKMGG